MLKATFCFNDAFIFSENCSDCGVEPQNSNEISSKGGKILSATRNEGVPTATCEKPMEVGSLDSRALHGTG